MGEGEEGRGREKGMREGDDFGGLGRNEESRRDETFSLRARVRLLCRTRRERT